MKRKERGGAHVGRKMCLLSCIGLWNIQRSHTVDANESLRMILTKCIIKHHVYISPIRRSAFCLIPWICLREEKRVGGGERGRQGDPEESCSLLPIVRTDNSAESHSGSWPSLWTHSHSGNRTANLEPHYKVVFHYSLSSCSVDFFFPYTWIKVIDSLSRYLLV